MVAGDPRAGPRRPAAGASMDAPRGAAPRWAVLPVLWLLHARQLPPGPRVACFTRWPEQRLEPGGSLYPLQPAEERQSGGVAATGGLLGQRQLVAEAGQATLYDFREMKHGQ